jgi:hypothetical protein
VALGEDLVAVGVPQLGLGAIDWPGDAFILQKEKDEWPLKARLTPDKSFVLRNYGIAVSLDGDSLIVGSDGVAWVYRLQQNQWQLRGELPVPKYKREQAVICSISQCQGKAALGVPSSEDENGPGFVKVVDLTAVRPQRP